MLFAICCQEDRVSSDAHEELVHRVKSSISNSDGDGRDQSHAVFVIEETQEKEESPEINIDTSGNVTEDPKAEAVDKRDSRIRASLLSSSSQSKSFTETHEKVQQFQEHRSLARKKHFHSVVAFALVMVFVSFALLVLGSLTYTPMLDIPILLPIAHPPGHFMAALGLTAFSSCPVQDLDIDEFLQGYPVRRHILWVFLFMLAWVQSEPIWGWPVGFVAFCGFVTSTCYDKIAGSSLQMPLQTTLLACWILGRMANASVIEIRQWLYSENELWNDFSVGSENLGCEDWITNYVSLAFLVPGGTVLAARYLWQRRSRARYQGRKFPPTLALWMLFYGFLLVWGLFFSLSVLTAAVARPHCFEDDREFHRALAEILNGVGVLVPLVPILLLGRQKYFLWIAERTSYEFEMSQAETDGSFMAELLNDCVPQDGDEMWLRHGRHDPRYEWWDPRHDWQLGAVVEETGEHYCIEPEDPEADVIPGLLRENLIYKIPKANRHMEAREMLMFAKDNLRCVDFKDIESLKDTLFFSEEVTQVNLTTDRLTGGNLHSKSRPLQKGERIDFFMSHSWHDESQGKWEKLKEFASDFRRQHKRDPVLWLDNVCIDQSKLADGLRILPINLMACRKLLIVAGSTYASRLWCVWELLVLFAFTGEREAVKRVCFLPIGDDNDGMEIIQSLKQFDARRAHCYDPNEESKVRRVIGTLGIDLFNARIQSFATAVEAKLLSGKLKKSNSNFF
mmetsp:Transcript_2432/g.4491  ORF Transcript_2432/g.4491 Transcript_2432/m.4491 type:complete len:735 (-) Transcript_2432:51-2255(-)